MDGLHLALGFQQTLWPEPMGLINLWWISGLVTWRIGDNSPRHQELNMRLWDIATLWADATKRITYHHRCALPTRNA
eukprot:1158187-Pelagomonas_calceolata.AAC.1